MIRTTAGQKGHTTTGQPSFDSKTIGIRFNECDSYYINKNTKSTVIISACVQIRRRLFQTRAKGADDFETQRIKGPFGKITIRIINSAFDRQQRRVTGFHPIRIIYLLKKNSMS